MTEGPGIVRESEFVSRSKIFKVIKQLELRPTSVESMLVGCWRRDEPLEDAATQELTFPPLVLVCWLA